MAQDDELDVIEVVDDDWISVKYDNEIGYVSAEFVDLDFHIDEGETIASIKAKGKGGGRSEGEADGKPGRGSSGRRRYKAFGGAYLLRSGQPRL